MPTISSINSNEAALLAQLNIGTATQNTNNDVAALSSGNRIVNASTDVAALSAGTGLAGQVNVLTSSIAVVAQGSSLLQVADGGLAQIQSILQQQQAIAAQANNGTLSGTQLGFLNAQFQTLTSEINAIANQTNFNGVSLLNGGISGSDPLQSAETGATAAVISGVTTAGTPFTSATYTTIGTNNDSAFYGALSGGTFSVSDDNQTAAYYDITYTLNGSTYIGRGVPGTASANFVLSDGSGSINILMGGTALPTAATAGNLTLLQSELTTFFSGATAYSVRNIATADATNVSTGAKIANSAIAATSANGEDYTAGGLLAGFTGSNVTIQSALYSGANIPSISGFSATLSGTSATTLSLTLNGNTYTTGAIAGGSNLATATFGGGAAGIGTFYLNGNTTSNEKVTINFGGITDAAHIDLTTSNGVSGLLSGFNNLFGGGGSGLSFQAGTSSADTLGVTLNSATSSALFANASIDVLSQSDASTASTAVQTALNTVTALRAQAGAYEQQFNYATNALTSAQQNETAAESGLLDTNVAATSTQFATDQVKLQAGIAVLAQADQLPQNLLKLIG